MEIKSKFLLQIFQKSIQDWHLLEKKKEREEFDLNQTQKIENLLYEKNQIDTIQWHIEDEIRRQDISTQELASLKRKIDQLNQERTNKVEELDILIFNEFYPKTKVQKNAKMNSETPAWLIDRMSILELKIYHMREQTERKEVDKNHIETCQNKLEILLEQRQDLSICFDELLLELKQGTRYFKIYKQMKMYNEPTLNPALYKNK